VDGAAVKPRALARAIVAWAVATALACLAVHHAFALTDVDRSDTRAWIWSVWNAGQRVGRAVGHSDLGVIPDSLRGSRAAEPGDTVVAEIVVGEGPVITRPEPLFALSFVPGRDGMAVTYRGRTEYLTPDDLLARQAYDKGVAIDSIGLRTGVDVPVALAMLSERFGSVPAPELLHEARFRRVRMVREVQSNHPPPRPVDASTLTPDIALGAAVAAARFIARGVDADGRFRYLVDAPTNRTLPGYDWPRHAGATFFLAQAAAASRDPGVAWAALRSASFLRDHAVVDCGEHRCVGSDAMVDAGSTALTVLAFVEIARTGLDPSYARDVASLTAFLRALQRPDGDLMHLYDRRAGHAIDVQLLYYTGEAAFALARAHTLLGDPRDLDAARRALARLVSGAWSFFGSRYYRGEEHWTCQAMDDLWERAPSPEALSFCRSWQAYGRALQYSAGDTALDVDGAYGFGPLVTPPLTPAGSRTEAGVATLEVAERAGVRAAEVAALDEQMRRALAMLVRHQLRADGPEAHLLANPGAIDGAIPASEVDWQLRIDFAQHSGAALLRWYRLRHP
jgi:hypothetical protein